jgi:hypothetical protein
MWWDLMILLRRPRRHRRLPTGNLHFLCHHHYLVLQYPIHLRLNPHLKVQSSLNLRRPTHRFHHCFV